MGDGYWLNAEGTLFLCSENFTLEDIQTLLHILRIKFQLVVTTKKRGQGFRLRFSSRELNLRKLRALVQPHVHPFNFNLGTGLGRDRSSVIPFDDDSSTFDL